MAPGWSRQDKKNGHGYDTAYVGNSCTSSGRTEHQSSVPVPPNLVELQYNTSRVQSPSLCPGTVCLCAKQPMPLQLMRSVTLCCAEAPVGG